MPLTSQKALENPKEIAQLLEQLASDPTNTQIIHELLPLLELQ